MREILRYGLILMLVAGISAGSLALVKNATEERRKAILEEETQKALVEVLHDAEVFQPVKSGEDILYYIGYQSKLKEKASGYACIADGKGYSSVIVTMVGLSPDGRIKGLKVLSQQETPGLGARIEEVEKKGEKPWFQRQFIGKDVDELSLDEIDTISGATISSKAVLDSVKEKARETLSSVVER